MKLWLDDTTYSFITDTNLQSSPLPLMSQVRTFPVFPTVNGIAIILIIMKSFKCPYCERHQNAIGFTFDWNKEGRNRFRMHLKVFHARKNIKKTLRYVKKHL